MENKFLQKWQKQDQKPKNQRIRTKINQMEKITKSVMKVIKNGKGSIRIM